LRVILEGEKDSQKEAISSLLFPKSSILHRQTSEGLLLRSGEVFCFLIAVAWLESAYFLKKNAISRIKKFSRHN